MSGWVKFEFPSCQDPDYPEDTFFRDCPSFYLYIPWGRGLSSKGGFLCKGWHNYTRHGVVMVEGLVTNSHLVGDGSVNKKPNWATDFELFQRSGPYTPASKFQLRLYIYIEQRRIFIHCAFIIIFSFNFQLETGTTRTWRELQDIKWNETDIEQSKWRHDL